MFKIIYNYKILATQRQKTQEEPKKPGRVDREKNIQWLDSNLGALTCRSFNSCFIFSNWNILSCQVTLKFIISSLSDIIESGNMIITIFEFNYNAPQGIYHLLSTNHLLGFAIITTLGRRIGGRSRGVINTKEEIAAIPLVGFPSLSFKLHIPGAEQVRLEGSIPPWPVSYLIGNSVYDMFTCTVFCFSLCRIEFFYLIFVLFYNCVLHQDKYEAEIS